MSGTIKHFLEWGRNILKYVKRIPTADAALSELLIKSGWKKLKEPPNLGLAILFSIPFVFFLSGIVLWVSYLLNPALFGFINDESLKITFSIDLKLLLLTIAVIGYMFVHELIHALFIPNFLQSDKTFMGINGLFGFVFTTEIIRKFRFIVISVMPFLLLSLLPVFLLGICGLLNWYILSLCLINAAGSCIDFLNVILVAFQVPSRHFIINSGFETYYSLTNC